MLLNNYQLERHMQEEVARRHAAAGHRRAAGLPGYRPLTRAPQRVMVRLGRLILVWQI